MVIFSKLSTCRLVFKLSRANQRNLSSNSRPVTNKLEFIEPSKQPEVPIYRVLNQDGTLAASLHSDLNKEKILDLYNGMIKLNTMDRIMFDSHRQGRISFYMTSFGEEATQFGSVGGLDGKDLIYAQYRESGLLIHRGMSFNSMLAQCYGNKEDLGKGRQMPIHYGSRELNYVTISSTLATQMPQAAGTAYSLKRNASPQIVACYFGEGAASEGDAHAAMNFAATLDCPMIFFCRNNGYAISTPTMEQFKSDGVVNRGIGYGMSSIRVDGNDLFAMFAATRAAREICLKESRPVLIEAMSYRVGHHSTSDDSTAYRSVDEIKDWRLNDDPIQRVCKYLINEGIWSEGKDNDIKANTRKMVIDAINYAEKVKRLPVTSLFEDVYDELPNNLKKQKQELISHLNRFGEHYPINEYEKI